MPRNIRNIISQLSRKIVKGIDYDPSEVSRLIEATPGEFFDCILTKHYPKSYLVKRTSRGICVGLSYYFLLQLDTARDSYDFIEQEGFLKGGLKHHIMWDSMLCQNLFRNPGEDIQSITLLTKKALTPYISNRETIPWDYQQLELGLAALTALFKTAQAEIITLTGQHHEICLYISPGKGFFDLFDPNYGVFRFNTAAYAAYVAHAILDSRRSHCTEVVISRYRKIATVQQTTMES